MKAIKEIKITLELTISEAKILSGFIHLNCEGAQYKEDLADMADKLDLVLLGENLKVKSK